MNRIVFAATLAAATVAARAADQQKPADPNFPPRTNIRGDILKEFDKDGDGKLSEQEKTAMIEARKTMADKMHKAREKEFDKDGDGTLNEQEKAAMMQARQAMRDKFMKEREKEFDKDGDGKLNEQEKAAMMEAMKQRHTGAGPNFQEIIKRFDKDGDGKLNDEERKAAMEARGKHGEKPAEAKPAEAAK